MHFFILGHGSLHVLMDSSWFLSEGPDLVRESLTNFVSNFWENPSITADINKRDICLILKVSKPEFVSQFRLISFCNTLYKVVTKVIVNRLKCLMNKLVSPFQTGFIHGRNIRKILLPKKWSIP